MMGPFSFTLTPPRLTRSIAPEKLILDTRELLCTLRCGVERIPYLESSEAKIIELVLVTLLYQKNALYELAFMCHELTRDRLYTINETDAVMFAESIFSFGDALFAQLSQAQAYRDGYLHYQFNGLLNQDIILARLVPAPLL